MLKALKYKLQMFGIEMMENEPKCFGENNSVILSLPVSELTLKKENHPINYIYD